MYDFRYDPNEGILHLRLTSLWTVKTAREIVAALRTVAHDIADKGAPLRILSDARAFPVQTREVAEMIAAGPPSKQGRPSRTAIVVGSTLNRLQAARTVADERTRVFTDIAEARAWLLAPLAAIEDRSSS